MENPGKLPLCTNKTTFLSQKNKNKIIWNNSRILIGDRPVFFKPLFEAKIIRIKQFLKEDNTFFSLDELIRKVNISIPFTLYYGLVAAIPTEWKNILNQNNSHLNPLLKTFRRPVSPTLHFNQQRKSTNIREQNSKLRFLQRKHPQGVHVAFPNNQRLEINCFPV